MQQLREAQLTDVRYIAASKRLYIARPGEVCGTIAIEHKYYAPQWAKLFPKAEVWVSPRTFSWPVDFGPYAPLGGFARGKPLQKVPKDSSQAPWRSQARLKSVTFFCAS